MFISYAEEDDRKRRALTGALVKATPVFIPIVVSARREPGKPLTDKVMDCIIEADFLVPILTRSSISNQWVNQEIGYAQGKELRIVPIVEQEIIGDLKGFVHNQNDLPFSFSGNVDASRESASYRGAYRQLIEYLQNLRSTSFKASISPPYVASGDRYITSVVFKGAVINGFFDNYVVHQESGFTTWNWDPETIPPEPGRSAPSDIAPGVLNGHLDVSKSYSHTTRNWPKGRYKIFVRLYSHPTPGAPGRTVVAEDEHDFEVI